MMIDEEKVKKRINKRNKKLSPLHNIDLFTQISTCFGFNKLDVGSSSSFFTITHELIKSRSHKYFHSKFTSFFEISFIQPECIFTAIHLIASIPLKPMVFGARSERIQSNFSTLYSSNNFLQASRSVASTTAVTTHLKFTLTGCMSSHIVRKSRFAHSFLEVYCNRLPGLHHISNTFLTDLSKRLYLRSISSSL